MSKDKEEKKPVPMMLPAVRAELAAVIFEEQLRALIAGCMVDGLSVPGAVGTLSLMQTEIGVRFALALEQENGG